MQIDGSLVLRRESANPFYAMARWHNILFQLSLVTLPRTFLPLFKIYRSPLFNIKDFNHLVINTFEGTSPTRASFLKMFPRSRRSTKLRLDIGLLHAVYFWSVPWISCRIRKQKEQREFNIGKVMGQNRTLTNFRISSTSHCNTGFKV